jgi:hypothetical protein
MRVHRGCVAAGFQLVENPVADAKTPWLALILIKPQNWGMKFIRSSSR